ncbi:MAG TPA: ribonuclease III [Vicinamibacterales bacterium]|jgi:ribonuclease-3|nr:ribonuclease III [Vicinamibacterales bacterium]
MSADPVVIFRTHSEIEASIVRGLLEAHGIPVLVSSGLTRSVFPVAISGPNELKVSVNEDDAAEARRLIESHRQEMSENRVVPLRDEFRVLEDRIDYRFRDPGLLEHALTHRSRVHEDASGGVFDNESLEFLGDAVLGFVIADLLFREFPQHNEGEKSKIKASIVSAPSLGRLAEKIGLGDFLILGRGEEKSGGRQKMALVSDSYEALIAAIYMDGSIQAARTFIEREFSGLIEEARTRGTDSAFTMDFKSALQEWLQSKDRGLPEYRLAAEQGPAHRRTFDVEVLIGGEVVARGSGRSKKSAEQKAARGALEALAQMQR